MKQIKKRLTYANVMSSIAVFLVLGGATAIAASELGKNSVGTKQLKKNAVTKAKIKKNAVTSAKIKNNAVTGAKIKNGAVNGAKVADGSLTGADIAAGSTPFSQVVTRLRTPGPVSLDAVGSTPVGSYVQGANEINQIFAGLDVTFSAGCTGPRSAQILLLMDPVNPAAPTIENVVSIALASDNSAGTVTKRAEFIEYPIGLLSGLRRMGPATAQTHTFYLYSTGAECEGGGSGVTGSNIGLDVIGTK